MTTSSKEASSVGSTRAAFTLAETMVAVSILAIVLASMIPTFVFFTKSITGLGNYTIMSGESRGALERFGRDLHAAEDLTLASASELTVLLPEDLGGTTVNYKFDPADKNLIRKKTDSSGALLSEDTLFEDVDTFKFVYYNRLSVDVSDSASILAEAKSVQINAKLLKRVITTKTTDYIISARFLMRNHN
ncbi:hypothetical protein DDZ13_04820 [Coraliomargarita sinensis]|uniref:Prepilin-type N-terminal cleavage/methylation domain-containing protein n=1 Tax=Coraliomargarita sinensis TaxID=2174842 RepID=A0A317ZM85_9BACT|nr:prepilin-type N-terminal cleavage/methylation domain-containing protein [Coraliomargarita sinensis]PXA04501.1 hypothetical protein DDZ13_04820 [Coraliomargarita sinensis]